MYTIGNRLLWQGNSGEKIPRAVVWLEVPGGTAVGGMVFEVLLSFQSDS
jgi:hypothetical protein